MGDKKKPKTTREHFNLLNRFHPVRPKPLPQDVPHHPKNCPHYTIGNRFTFLGHSGGCVNCDAKVQVHK